MLVNVEDSSCSIMMGIPPIEWDHLQSPIFMFFQTSSQEVLQMEPIIDKVQEALLHKKQDSNIMHVGDTILAAAEESGIDEYWCLLNNQSRCNAFINGKYLSNIRYAPDGKYLRVHCNAGVTYTNKIGDLHGYSNTV